MFEAPASVWDVTTEDIDGDGRKEIVALYSDDDSGLLDKGLAVFRIPHDDGAPSLVHALAADSSVLAFAEIDGTAPRELLACDGDGIDVYAYRDGVFVRIRRVEMPTLFPTRAREPVFYQAGVIDLDEDGRDEWLIPVAGGYVIRTLDAELARIDADMSHELSRFGGYYLSGRLPALRAYSVADDGFPQGVALLSDRFADFYFGEAWEHHKRHPIPIGLDRQWDANARMRDLNGDGFPDIVVTQTRGTINLEVLTQVYLARGPYEYAAEPDATYAVDGAFTAPGLADVNGDDRLDLILVRVPINFRNLVSYFFRRKVSVRADVYLLAGSAYPEEPDFTAGFTIDAPEGRQQVVYTTGDFDGDKRLDAAIAAGGERLAVYLGDPKRFIREDPEFEIEMPAFGVARKADIDGNGRDDIVVHHPGESGAARVDVILF